MMPLTGRWKPWRKMVPKGSSYPAPVAASYLLSILAVLLVLRFHLLAAVFAGLAVHVLTLKLALRLPVRGGLTHKLALAVLAMVVTVCLTGTTILMWSALQGNGGMSALLATVADIVEKLRQSLPAVLADELPATVEDLQAELSEILREHGKNLSAVGMAGFKTFVHILLGMVIGGMTALHHFEGASTWPPLAAALHARSLALTQAFDKVVLAQVKIAALNTLLTALYLVVILPLCGIHLPLLTVLVPLTFVAGLLPVIGNLISNTAIVLISLGISPLLGATSLLFLVGIHKLEYFTNARIVGGEVHATAWELLSAMLVMEALFGVAGLIAAPVVYAWLKSEIKTLNLI